MEGWGGDMPSEVQADGGGAEAPDQRDIDKLVRQRDMLLREAAAIQNKVAGLEMAIKILSE